MSPRVMRFVEWTIGAPRGEAPKPVILVRCLEPGCDQESEASRSHMDADRWALQHAGRTGHTEYDEIARCRLVATQKER
ncbi:DUF7848 domain-containing protein [Streptomyces laculatispora]|uniref:DUF7848 domain-containing protein n=1 Tax=Streptomyces laculatispora TaxID=887464 RepID=UPI001A94CBB0|nr:hypothetical protein [Streptomyces laculatispora]MBO0918845.1 hypothetical protein [Streptomyces laculatispora]